MRSSGPELVRPRIFPRRVSDAALVTTLTGLCAVLSFWRIGSKSLWRDEGFSVSTSLRSWRSLWHLSVHTESNGVLYNFLLKLWSAFGTSEASLRSFSAVLVVATVPSVYRLGRLVTSSRAALIAAGIAAVHGSFITYAQTIRSYPLSILLATWSTIAFVTEVRRPTRLTFAAWIVVSLALVHTHLLAGLLVVGQLASLVWLPVEGRRVRRRVGAVVVIAAFSLPIAYAISQNEEGQGLISFSLGAFRDVLHVMTGRGGLVGFAAFGLMGLLAVRATLRSFHCVGNDDRWAHWLMVSCTVGPAALMVLGSLAQPMVIGRYLLFLLPTLTVWAGIGLDRFLAGDAPQVLRSRGAQFVVGIVISIGLMRGPLFWLQGGGVENWRAASRVVFTQAEANDGVLFANDSVRLFFEYYRTHLAHGADPISLFPSPPWGHFGTGDQTYLSFTPTIVRATVTGHRRVWVVLGRKHVHVNGVPAALVELDKTHQRAREFLIDDIVVWRYDLR